jgi:hypothetical protein
MTVALVAGDRVLAKYRDGSWWYSATVVACAPQGLHLYYDMGRELPENESQDPVPLAEVRFAKEVRHNYESRSLPEGAQEVTMAENDVAEKQRRRERAKLQEDRKAFLKELVGLRVISIGDKDVTGGGASMVHRMLIRNMTEFFNDSTSAGSGNITFQARISYRVLMQVPDLGCRRAHVAQLGVELCPEDVSIDQSQAGSSEPFILPDTEIANNGGDELKAVVRGLLPGVKYQFWVQMIQGDKMSPLSVTPTCECTTNKTESQPSSVSPLAGGNLPVNCIKYERPQNTAPTGFDAVELCNELFGGSTADAFAGLYDVFVGRTSVDLVRTEQQRAEDAQQAKGTVWGYGAYNTGGWTGGYTGGWTGGTWDPIAYRLAQEEKRRLEKLRQDAKARRLKPFQWECSSCKDTQDVHTRICRKCGTLNTSPKDETYTYSEDVEWATVSTVAVTFWSEARTVPGFGMVWNDKNVVTHVAEGGCAESKDVQKGDRIISVNGVRVDEEKGVNFLLANEERLDGIEGSDAVENTFVYFGFQRESSSKRSDTVSSTALVVAALAARARLVKAPVAGDDDWFLHAVLLTMLELASTQTDGRGLIGLPPFAYNHQQAALADLNKGCSASFGPLLRFFTSVADECTRMAQHIVDAKIPMQVDSSTRTMLDTRDTTKPALVDQKSTAAIDDTFALHYRQTRPSFRFSLEEFHVNCADDPLGRSTEPKFSLSEADLQSFAQAPLGFIANQFTEQVSESDDTAADAFKDNLARLRKGAKGNTAAIKSLDRLQRDLKFHGSASGGATYLRGMASLLEALESTSMHNIRTELEQAHAQCMKLVAVLNAQFNTEYHSTQDSIEAVRETLSNFSASMHGKNSNTEEVEAAKLELMVRAGRAYCPSLMSLVGLMMSADHATILGEVNQFVKNPEALFVGVAGVVFRCIRLRQLRSCVAASQRLADGLSKLLVDAVLDEVRRQLPISPHQAVKLALSSYRVRTAAEVLFGDNSGHESVSYSRYDNSEAIQQVEAVASIEAAWLQIVKSKFHDDADATGRVIIATTTLAQCNIRVSLADNDTVNGEYVVANTLDGVVSYEHSEFDNPMQLFRGIYPSDDRHGKRCWIFSCSNGRHTTHCYYAESSASLPPKRGWMKVVATSDTQEDVDVYDGADHDADRVSELTIKLVNTESGQAARDKWLVGDELGAQLELARRGCHAGADCILPDMRRFRAVDADSLAFSIGAQASVLRSTADALTALLLSKREYASTASSDLRRSKTTRSTIVCLDPRFLVFEFVSPFMLRKMQVDILGDFIKDAHTTMSPEQLKAAPRPQFMQRSAVKQMIMGAGKTTVIGPLLCVVLADGKKLVSQIVPDALLAMSCEVMFSVLSTVFSTRVYTLVFERSSLTDGGDVATNIYKKAKAAKDTGGVMITTPNSVKALVLSYIDELRKINEFSAETVVPRRHYKKWGTEVTEKRAFEAGMTLQAVDARADILANIMMLWREGVCLVDEVDMVLHPLRSETNFPVGYVHSPCLSFAHLFLTHDIAIAGKSRKWICIRIDGTWLCTCWTLLSLLADHHTPPQSL